MAVLINTKICIIKEIWQYICLIVAKCRDDCYLLQFVGEIIFVGFKIFAALVTWNHRKKEKRTLTKAFLSADDPWSDLFSLQNFYSSLQSISKDMKQKSNKAEQSGQTDLV